MPGFGYPGREPEGSAGAPSAGDARGRGGVYSTVRVPSIPPSR